MADHYFTENPESAHKPAQFEAFYRGHALRFHTDSGVFSRTELDKGSAALLAKLPDNITGDVLDMGCGYGAIGISLKKHNPSCTLTMADINERAVALAKKNAEVNGIDAEILQGDGFAPVINRVFDLIVCNPPIRAGKHTIYQMFSNAANATAEQGAFILVIRKQQGAPSAVEYLRDLFGCVEVLSKKGGFWVLRCTGNHCKTNRKE